MLLSFFVLSDALSLVSLLRPKVTKSLGGAQCAISRNGYFILRLALSSHPQTPGVILSIFFVFYFFDVLVILS